jgi:branched-chain amino acid transport system substrate-binding protein
MKKVLAILLSLSLVSFLFTGCASKASSSGNNEGSTIKVGLDYELSGDVATYGQGLTEGIEFAVKEINANGGVLGKQIELVKVDNKSDNTESANVAMKLSTVDKVVAILGPATSGNTKSAAPVANQNKVPLISGSATADDVTVDSNGKVREYLFRTCFSDSFQGFIMANFAFNDLAGKNAAILVDSTSDYSKGLAKKFKERYAELGGKVVTEEAYQQKETDFRAVLTSIKATNPDVLFLPGYYTEVGLIVKQARELGLNVPVLGGDGYDSPKLAELAGKDALNKVYFTNHYSSNDTTTEVVKFKESYNAEYKKDPNAFNALGYDMAYFLVDALKRAGEANSEKVKEALATTKDFSGITGTLSVDENHNAVKSITILEVKDGEPTFLTKVEP